LLAKGEFSRAAAKVRKFLAKERFDPPAHIGTEFSSPVLPSKRDVVRGVVRASPSEVAPP